MRSLVFNFPNSALVASAAFLLAGTIANSKPLITNSQSTYASACLEQNDTPERLVEICHHALDGNGASDRQRIEMLDRLGWAYFDLDEIDKSDEAFSRILDIDPDAEPGLQGRAWVFYDRDDYDEAAAFFRKAVSRAPTASNLAGLAASEYRGDFIAFDDFEVKMRAALALDPEYSWALRELAWALSRNSRDDEAMELFRTAIDVNPDDSYAEYGVAFLLSEQDRWEESFTHITRTLELNPEFVSALSRRSLILLMLDRPKLALNDAEAVIAASPDDADGYVRKARALSELGRRAEAHQVLEKAEGITGPSSYLLFWRASLLTDDHDYDAALVQIRRSVDLDDANHFDHRLHAEIALWLDHTKEARQAIDLALKESPDIPYIQYVNALVLVSEGQYQSAETSFDAAVNAGLSDHYLDDFIAALIEEGQFTQAIKTRVRHTFAH